jgi:hypothetical protein
MTFPPKCVVATMPRMAEDAIVSKPGLALMRLRLGMGLFVLDTTAWQSLAGHLLYGFVLGVVYPLALARPAPSHQEHTVGR